VSEIPKHAFVIMPFSDTPTQDAKDWTDTFNRIFKPAFEAAGYSCHRAVPTTGNLISSIIENLYNASVVLAVLQIEMRTFFTSWALDIL
jgi:hypothetical protein